MPRRGDIISQMVLSIELAPEIESRLREQARAAGKDLDEFVGQLVEHAVAKPSLDEVLAPLRKQFAESGTSDEQLVNEITAAQAAYRADRTERSK